MKKFIALLVSIVLSISLTACAAPTIEEVAAQFKKQADEQFSDSFPDYMTYDVFANGDSTIIVEYTLDLKAANLDFDQAVTSIEASADKDLQKAGAEQAKNYCPQIQTYVYQYITSENELLAVFEY